MNLSLCLNNGYVHIVVGHEKHSAIGEQGDFDCCGSRDMAGENEIEGGDKNRSLRYTCSYSTG